MRAIKKVVLIPDSFKGTMSSLEICGIMGGSIKKFYPDAEIISIPVADGGEGSVDAFLAALGGEKRTVSVKNPFFEDIEAFFGILSGKADAKRTAVIEMAASSGLPLVSGRLDPEAAATYGAGELIKAALDAGAQKIILGLGGSATNDGGCGAAAALGAEFFDRHGKTFIPAGGTLKNIAHIDISKLDPRLTGIEKVGMCDIDNPLYGKNGAAYIFAPQKGASPEMVEKLDAGLRHLAEVVKRDLGLDIAESAGVGAAGGMGYGIKAFLNFELGMGIEIVLDTVGFDALISGADVVFSGEGKIDTQSLRGKVICGVARRTKRAAVPLIAVVGDIGDGIEEACDIGVSAVFSINRVAVPYAEARLRAKSDLRLTMDNIMRFSVL